MSTDSTPEYDIRINDRQRALLASALLTFICEGGFQGQAAKADLEEAEELMACLNSPDAPLATEGLNDLTPIF